MLLEMSTRIFVCFKNNIVYIIHIIFLNIKQNVDVLSHILILGIFEIAVNESFHITKKWKVQMFKIWSEWASRVF